MQDDSTFHPDVVATLHLIRVYKGEFLELMPSFDRGYAAGFWASARYNVPHWQQLYVDNCLHAKFYQGVAV